MLAVPPALLDVLHLEAGSKVGISVEGGRLVVAAKTKPRYKLEELLAQCDPNAPRSEEGQEWLNDGAVGGELI